MPGQEKESGSMKTWIIGFVVILIVIVLIVVLVYWNSNSTTTQSIAQVVPTTVATMPVARMAEATKAQKQASKRKELQKPHRLSLECAKTGGTSGTATGKFKPYWHKCISADYIQSVEANPYTPQQIGSVYDAMKYPFNGQGKKIGIVDAFAYPTLQQDFDIFCQEYGLPSSGLQIHNLGSQTDSGWAVEIALDVEMAHIFAPNAEIHVFLAADDSAYSFQQAIEMAATSGMDVVSMSFGGSEDPEFINLIEPIFERFPKTIFCASSGDNDVVSYPSSSPRVVSVGGTVLFVSPENLGFPARNTTAIQPGRFPKIGESNWSSPDGSGTGHGISEIFSRPAFQRNCDTSLNRSTPDISLIAATPDDNGVSIYTQGQWGGVEGTSVSCPILAGLLATALSYRREPFTQFSLLNALYPRFPSETPTDIATGGCGFVNSNFLPFIVNSV